MKFLGRRILMTTLDPVPRSMRAVPGIIVMNHLEKAKLEENDGETFKLLAEIVQAEDAADVHRTYIYRKGKKRKKRINPSSRLMMLQAGFGKR